jgi:hypothetical protein
MALTRSGDLLRVAPSDDGLVVHQRLADGSQAEYLVPQTAGIVASSLQVGVDEPTGAIYVAWQQGAGNDASIELAWLADQWWIGPYTIAGNDGSAVENLQLMLDTAFTVVETDDGPVEVATRFLHLVWWSYVDTRDDGTAYLASIPLGEAGNVLLDELQPFALSDLLPYGVGCDGIQDDAGLAHPKIFSDPQTGAPHIFATDFSNCVFQVLRIAYEVEEVWVGDTKRRRHIVLLGRESMIAANSAMALKNAKVEVGHGLDVVLYWDVEDAVAYVQLDENGVPPVETLAYGDALTREQAIEMVRSLVH